MPITMTEATRIMTAMGLVFTATHYAYKNEIPTAELLESTIHDSFIEFCKLQGIESVEEEDKCPDFSDDVDESNYDPFMGSDFFEDLGAFGEGW